MANKLIGLDSIRLFKNLTWGEFLYVYDKRTKHLKHYECNTYFKENDKGHYEFVLWIDWDNDAVENFLYPNPMSEWYEDDNFYVTTMLSYMKDYVFNKCGDGKDHFREFFRGM